MLARAARAVLFLATILVVSTLARSAFAVAAPFCDDRGATALAAPPVLEAPDEAIRKARVVDCGTRADADAWLAALGPARARLASASDDAPQVRLPEPIRIVRASAGEADMPDAAGQPRAGAYTRVERPPRG